MNLIKLKSNHPIYYMLLFSIMLSSCKTVKDIDKNKYEKIKIGDQKWLSENLKVTKFNDGTVIPLVVDNTEWSRSTSPAYSWYNNEPCNGFGALYNVKTITSSKNVCPRRWKVPSLEDWKELVSQFENGQEAAKKLMKKGNMYWINDYGATNESEFGAVGSGQRIKQGFYTNKKLMALWWNSENSDTNNQIMSINQGTAGQGAVTFGAGLPIRCIKD